MKRKKECSPIRIRIMKQTLYGRQDGRDVVGGTPPVLENV
jgi:hypothetical protein